MKLTREKLEEIKHGDLYRALMWINSKERVPGYICRYTGDTVGFIFLWRKKDEQSKIGSWSIFSKNDYISADISGIDVDSGWYFSSPTEYGREFHIASEPYKTEVSTISTLYRMYKNASMDKTPGQKETSVEITLITKHKLIKVNQQF